MNNTWTYSQLFSVLKRWFVSRWWDIICDDQWLMDYINLAIQDIYNEDNSTWRHITEDIIWVADWEYYKYKTTLPIHKIQKCHPYVNSYEVTYEENQDIRPTLFKLHDRRDCKFDYDTITTTKDVKRIIVTYLVDYVPVTLADLSKPVPIPFRYMSVVLKMAFDWAAPINLMAWEVQTTDFYSHWITRLNKIKDNDSLSDYIDWSPAY